MVEVKNATGSKLSLISGTVVIGPYKTANLTDAQFNHGDVQHSIFKGWILGDSIPVQEPVDENPLDSLPVESVADLLHGSTVFPGTETEPPAEPAVEAVSEPETVAKPTSKSKAKSS